MTLSIFVALKATGVLDDFDAERVRSAVDAAGAWGVLLFAALFVLGELVHVPGMVFIAAATLAYGRTFGFAVGLGSAVCSVAVSFLLVRAIGGKALAELERPLVKRIMAKLDERPITTVLILRSILWLSPPLNYALALSNIRFSHYLIGSTFGLVVPVLGASFLFDWFFG